MGEAKGQVRSEKGRSQESHCPPPNVASNEEEDVRSHEKTVGSGEKIWQ